MKIHKNTAIIFTVTLHGWISLHKMFNVSSLLLDNALKPTTPLINCAVNETLGPLCDDCFFQLIHCSETSTTVYHLLKGAPNSVVDWIQVRAVWGPHVRLNERNVLTSQILIVFLAVCDGAPSCCRVQVWCWHIARMSDKRPSPRTFRQ